MNDVMLDLETLGTVPGCAILSIGAVAFDIYGKAMDDGIYIVVDSTDCCDIYDCTTSLSTLDWWSKQSDEARAVFTDPRMVSLKEALETLNSYLRSHGKPRVWGNGADFDNPILAVLYERTGIQPGWAPYNGRCYRTVKNMARDIKLVRQGTYHNALDDAKSQADHLMDIVSIKNLRIG